MKISESALIKRINRKLAADGERLHTTRGERWRGERGDHFIIDERRNFIVAKHVDVRELARELGCL